MYLAAVFACVAIVLSGNARARSVDERINVSVYYESHCPDSRDFIVKELFPNFCKVQQYLNLNLVPFGKAYSTDDGDFRCQHGEKECRGNTIHNCALKRIQDPIARVGYVNCAMRNPDQPGQIDVTCVKKFGLDVDDVQRCYTSQEGYDLMLIAESATLENTSAERTGPKFVPTIVFEGVYSDRDQVAAFEDFERTICAKLSARGKQNVCSNGSIVNRTTCS
ncbi:gamma-interferon-inducible lysosomal thiol reductase-like [Adelges cooleyi]|uniref:gamma-interferon-inducible lysosomal thiol reductase-like n=1 Tax=Adelges cooleyi TaxID=133065 RepID=UPI00217F6008|nr:gamma-interferon-inducible lysosomal thiol reductase-like [Adelges cooleyi]